MSFGIPNPTKKVTVNFPIDVVKKAVKNFPLCNSKYNFFEEHEVMNTYIFEALEFLSLGVYIDVCLNEISETKTEINIEVRRKLGAFDEWYEVSKAGRHINSLLTNISNLLEHPELVTELQRDKELGRVSRPISQPNAGNNEGSNIGAQIFAVVAVIFLIIVIVLSNS